MDKISPRGRPKLYSNILKIRITPNIKRKIDQAAAKWGITKSEFIRDVIQATLERMEEK